VPVLELDVDICSSATGTINLDMTGCSWFLWGHFGLFSVVRLLWFPALVVLCCKSKSGTFSALVCSFSC
jgi:hypothetical protein